MSPGKRDALALRSAKGASPILHCQSRSVSCQNKGGHSGRATRSHPLCTTIPSAGTPWENLPSHLLWGPGTRETSCTIPVFHDGDVWGLLTRCWDLQNKTKLGNHSAAQTHAAQPKTVGIYRQGDFVRTSPLEMCLGTPCARILTTGWGRMPVCSCPGSDQPGMGATKWSR
jgi:hypothetical protein